MSAYIKQNKIIALASDQNIYFYKIHSISLNYTDNGKREKCEVLILQEPFLDKCLLSWRVSVVFQALVQ